MKTNKQERKLILKDFDLALINYLHGNHKKLSAKQREILCEELPKLDKKTVTLRSLCNALGIEVPAKFEDISNETQRIAFRSNRVKRGDISLVIRSSEDFGTSELANQYNDSIAKGAKLVIMGREEFEKLNLNEEEAPVILMDHANERIFRLFSIIRKQNDTKVVMLTGSVGKTTTKDLCSTVSMGKFRTYVNENNTNTPHQIAMHLFYRSGNDNEVFIHEAGAGYFGSVRFSASMLQPDVLVLTNVYNHHLQVYKTFENIFADKVSGDDYLSEDGVVITNYDDENIRNHKFKHTVKSFSVHYTDADFRAVNIRQHQENLLFDVYEKKTEKITPVKVNILGEHNVYNILAAFVLGKHLGMTETEIQNSLSEYKTVGVRQNLTNIGGVHLLMDCYNVAEESILAMLSAGEKFELYGNGKRIALIGGENKLGKDVKSRSEAFAHQLKDLKIDRYLFCGTDDRSIKALNHFGDAQSIYEGFKKISTTPSQLSASIDDMAAFLRENVKRDDLVMVKGIYYLQMPIAVDKVFGTSFSFPLSHNQASMKSVAQNGCQANLIEDFGELELCSAPIENETVMIPDTIGNFPVFRIKNNTFSKNADIAAIDFGAAVKNIGANAFSQCVKLKELHIPGNVKVIEKQAFSGCADLRTVTMAEGVTHISSQAFKGCKKLKEVYIPATVGMIEENVFMNCLSVIMICPKNSVAHHYAIDNQITFKII